MKPLGLVLPSLSCAAVLALAPGLSAQWTTIPFPDAGRDVSMVTAVGSKVYVIGGNYGDGGLSDRVDIYDETTGTWSQGTPMPYPLMRAAVTSKDGMIYIAGGQNFTSGFLDNLLLVQGHQSAPLLAVCLVRHRGQHEGTDDGANADDAGCREAQRQQVAAQLAA